jgi:hypothetical protein
MRKELDEALCKKYPKIFRDRHGNMRDTAMCWGFECRDGWYNILDKACSLIQGHIDYTRAQRARALRYNRALRRAVRGDVRPLQMHFTSLKCTEPSEYGIKEAAKVLEDIEPQCKRVPEACPQVVATQIKEKFGTLRFYYFGGDDYCHGVESMAESMSAVTCEVCGSSGKLRNGGWIRTLCDEHAKEAGYQDGELVLNQFQFGFTHG